MINWTICIYTSRSVFISVWLERGWREAGGGLLQEGQGSRGLEVRGLAVLDAHVLQHLLPVVELGLVLLNQQLLPLQFIAELGYILREKGDR